MTKQVNGALVVACCWIVAIMIASSILPSVLALPMSFRPRSLPKPHTKLHAFTSNRSTSNRASSSPRSKRQERVGQLVRGELSSIVYHGHAIKGANVEYLDDDVRHRIAVISCDVSPDLRQARVAVSVRRSSNNDDATIDQRRALAWLIAHNKAIKHALSQRISHMKFCPNLTFVQVDVAAAVDVMYLIDKVAAGAKRDDVGQMAADYEDGLDDDFLTDNADDDEDFF